jgi:hypothetical protein
MDGRGRNYRVMTHIAHRLNTIVREVDPRLRALPKYGQDGWVRVQPQVLPSTAIPGLV